MSQPPSDRSSPQDEPPRVPPLQPAPPVLGYRPGENLKNSPGKFFARAGAGLGIGILGCVAGWALGVATNSLWMASIPLVLALGGAGAFALTQRKYGYFTGIILAPFFLVVGLAILLLIICGGMIVGSR